MTALRMTRPDTDRQPTPSRGRRTGFPRALAFGLGVALTAVAGCGRESSDGLGEPDPVAYRPSMAQLPPPATDRIEYDAGTRTLTFYDLPGTARWMVQVGGAAFPHPCGPEHRLPEGVDPQHTYVYYVRPGGQSSTQVSLAEIQASRPVHSSAR